MLELMGMDDVIAGGEKKRGKETGESEVGRVGGGVEKKEDQGRQARPRNPSGTPPTPPHPAHQQRSQGASALHPHYKRAAAVTGDCGLQYGFTAPSHRLSFTLTVYSHHGRDIAGRCIRSSP